MHAPNPDSGNKPDVIFPPDVAREYGIPTTTQRVWACHDRYGWKGLVFKIGTRTAYRRSEIEAWLESRRLGSKEQSRTLCDPPADCVAQRSRSACATVDKKQSRTETRKRRTLSRTAAPEPAMSAREGVAGNE